MRFIVAVITVLLGSCTTSFLELKGECVIQQWNALGYSMRRRMICDLPPPEAGESAVRDREEMDTNPFPNLWDFNNTADSPSPNLLEGEMEYPPAPEDKPDNDE